MNDNINDLNVGQVVYLCSKKEARVYPALVAEEINKTTLSGKSTSYVVKLPTEDAREVSLDTVDAEVFTSVEEAREKMLMKASAQIDMILEKASDLASIAFNVQPEQADPEISVENDEGEEYATVDLGDGVVGKIDLSGLDKLGAE